VDADAQEKPAHANHPQRRFSSFFPSKLSPAFPGIKGKKVIHVMTKEKLTSDDHGCY
jgi:hypothetical protein